MDMRKPVQASGIGRSKPRWEDEAEVEVTSEQCEEWGVCRSLWEWVTAGWLKDHILTASAPTPSFHTFPPLNCSPLTNHMSQSSFCKPYSNCWLQAPALNLRQGRWSQLWTETCLSTYPRHSQGRKRTKHFGNVDMLREQLCIKATKSTEDPGRHH